MKLKIKKKCHFCDGNGKVKIRDNVKSPAILNYEKKIGYESYKYVELICNECNGLGILEIEITDVIEYKEEK